MFARGIILALMCIGYFAVHSQPDGYQIARDLSNGWLSASEQGQYLSVAEDGTGTVHLLLDHSSYPGGLLLIKSAKDFSFYLNHKLVSLAKRELLIDLDSLDRQAASPWMISVSQRNSAALQTLILTKENAEADHAVTLRRESYFVEPSIIAGLMLSFFFVISRSSYMSSLGYSG